MSITVKVQTWGDDLRLPCFTNVAETAGLIADLDHLRRPTIPFQSKHLPALKRNKWFALQRPSDKTRTGLLVIWPEQKCCVYISGEPLSKRRPTPRVALLRLRIDPQFLGDGVGLTVFAATLSSTARRLTIEDTLLWKGHTVHADSVFSKRWLLAVQWIDHYCIMDPRLLGGLDIGIAKWESIGAVAPDGIWEFQSDDAGSRRLLWISYYLDSPVPYPAPAPVVVPEYGIRTPRVGEIAPLKCINSALCVVPKIETGPLVAVANRESGPDQWSLVTSDNVGLGRALVRTLDMSQRMRSSKAATLHVEVSWNDTFKKWEVKGISDSLASHSDNFDCGK